MTTELLTISTVGATAASTGHDGPPLFVPRGQLYYWTKDWQEGEREALRDLDEGRFRTFPDGGAATRWLFDDKD